MKNQQSAQKKNSLKLKLWSVNIYLACDGDVAFKYGGRDETFLFQYVRTVKFGGISFDLKQRTRLVNLKHADGSVDVQYAKIKGKWLRSDACVLPLGFPIEEVDNIACKMENIR